MGSGPIIEMDLPKRERRVKLRNLSDRLLSPIDNQPVRPAYYPVGYSRETCETGGTGSSGSFRSSSCLAQPNKRDNDLLMLADFFSILLNRRMECMI